MLSVPLQPQPILPTATGSFSPGLWIPGSLLQAGAALQTEQAHTQPQASAFFSPFLFRLPALFPPRIKYIKQIHLISHIAFLLSAKGFADPPV